MAKRLAFIFGTLFVIIGLLGFVVNPLIGREGLFLTNAAHDITHILLGLMLIVAGARTESAAVTTLYTVGAIYALLALLGFAQIGSDGHGVLLGMAHANGADNWLHVALAVLLIGSALTGRVSHTTHAPMHHR